MSNTDYFKPLTGYRAIAAYMVFFVHFNPGPKGTFLHDFLGGFGIGVPLFFVLSGFLIYTRYNEYKISIPFYKKYMINRIARIYPMYFIVTTVTILFNEKAAAFSPYWMKVYFLNITFLRGFFTDYVYTLVAPGWSLTVEEVFYLVAPFLFLMGMDSIKRYSVIFLAIFGLGWILSFISINLLHGYFWTSYKFMLLNTFFGHSFAFIIGIVVGILHKRVGNIQFRYFTLIGILGLIVSLLLLSQLNNLRTVGAEKVYTYPGLAVFDFFAIPFIGAILWGLVRERTWLSQLLSTELFQILGKSSYCFYLIHFGILAAIIHKFISGNFVVCFLLIIATAFILWRYVEEPLNERIRAQAKRYLAK